MDVERSDGCHDAGMSDASLLVVACMPVAAWCMPDACQMHV